MEGKTVSKEAVLHPRFRGRGESSKTTTTNDHSRTNGNDSRFERERSQREEFLQAFISGQFRNL